MNVVINLVLPFFALVGIGYAAVRSDLITRGGVAGINVFVFWFALPALLFFKLAETPIAEQFDLAFIFAQISADVVTYALAMGLGFLFFAYRPAELSLLGAEASFANTGYMGIPLILGIFGDDGTLPAVMVVVLNNVVILAVTMMLLEWNSSRSGSPLEGLVTAMQSLLRNPLIIAIIAGFAASLLEMKLPEAASRFGALLGGAAGPCALFALGATIAGTKGQGKWQETAFTVLMKLVIHPSLMLASMFFVFTVEPMAATIAVIMAALPIAANVFILATQYGTHVGPVARGVLATTTLAIISVSVILSVLGIG